MNLTLVWTISYISIASGMVAIAVAFYNPPQSQFLRVLRGLLIISGACEIISLLLTYAGIDNLFVGNIYRVLEFVFLAWVYYLALELKNRNTFFAVIIFLIVCLLANLFFFQGLLNSNSISKTIVSLSGIVFSLLFFYKITKELVIVNLTSLPMFWINSAVLFYFSGNLFLFMFDSYILTHLQEVSEQYWLLHNLLNIIKNILLAIGLWQVQEKVYR